MHPTAPTTRSYGVPLVGQATKETEVAPSSWMQRTLGSYLLLCDPPAAGAAVDDDAKLCNQAANAISVDERNQNRRAIVMAMTTVPSISLPLGWGLSRASYEQMLHEADVQASPYQIDVQWLPARRLGSYLAMFAEHRDPEIEANTDASSNADD